MHEVVRRSDGRGRKTEQDHRKNPNRNPGAHIFPQLYRDGLFILVAFYYFRNPWLILLTRATSNRYHCR